jgi:hypothetical protein
MAAGLQRVDDLADERYVGIIEALGVVKPVHPGKVHNHVALTGKTS